MTPQAEPLVEKSDDELDPLVLVLLPITILVGILALISVISKLTAFTILTILTRPSPLFHPQAVIIMLNHPSDVSVIQCNTMYYTKCDHVDPPLRCLCNWTSTARRVHCAGSLIPDHWSVKDNESFHQREN